MATKLLVHKNGALLAQVDVCTSPMRIGRGPENDIQLEDTQKRVSRTHAEVRIEDGQFVLIDVSANGTFVGGRRISRHPIVHGMAFTVGPYRLTLDESTVSTPVSGEFAPDADVSVTFPPVEESHAVPSRPPASLPAHEPPRTAHSRHHRGETTRLYVKRHWKEFTAVGLMIMLGVAVTVIVGSGDGAREKRQRHIDAARNLLERGGTADEIVANAQSALQQHLVLVLAASPSDADALALQALAQARATPPPPPPVAPPAPTVEDDLNEARAFSDQKAWPEALASVQRVLGREPGNTDALAMKDEIIKLSRKPTAPVLPRATALTADPLSFPWTGETAEAYAERLGRIRRLLSEASAELGRRNHDAVRSLVKNLEADTRPDDQARRDGGAIQNEIEVALAEQRELQEALDLAQREETAGELRKAHDILVTLRNSGSAVPDIADRIVALSRKMAREGEAAMKTLRSAVNANDTEAKARACRRALESLPADHADRRTAENLCR